MLTLLLFDLGASGAAAAAADPPVFLADTQLRWVTEVRTASNTELVAGTDYWVKPPTITTR